MSLDEGVAGSLTDGSADTYKKVDKVRVKNTRDASSNDKALHARIVLMR